MMVDCSKHTSSGIVCLLVQVQCIYPEMYTPTEATFLGQLDTLCIIVGFVCI